MQHLIRLACSILLAAQQAGPAHGSEASPELRAKVAKANAWPATPPKG